MTEVPAATEATELIRVVLAMATEGGLDMSAVGIAERANLPVFVVERVMAGPEYQRALTTKAERLLMHTVTRGLAKMDEIINSPNQKDSVRINAFARVVSALDAVAKHQPKAPQAPFQAQRVEELRRQIKQIKVKVNDGSDGRPRTDSSAEEAGPRGQHPDAGPVPEGLQLREGGEHGGEGQGDAEPQHQ